MPDDPNLGELDREWVDPVPEPEGLEPVQLPAPPEGAAFGVRSYMSVSHLRSSILQARAAERLQRAAKEKEDRRLAANVRSLVVSTLLSSGAYPESFINEVYRDASENLSKGPVGGLHQQGVDQLRRAYEATDGLRRKLGGFAADHGIEERHQTLVKFQLGLALVGSSPMHKGSCTEFQHAVALVKVRNALTHAEPIDQVLQSQVEGVDAEEPPIVRHLKSKVDPVPYYDEAPASEISRYLSADCARWAVETAHNLVREFVSRSGVNLLEDHRKVWSKRDSMSLESH